MGSKVSARNGETPSLSGPSQRAKAAPRRVFRKHKSRARKLFEWPKFNARHATARANSDVGIAGFGDFNFNAALDHRKIDELGQVLPPCEANSPYELD